MLAIFYLDDTLLMAESKEHLNDQTTDLIYLLQCLGFMINSNKIIVHPTQSLEFVGFAVNTNHMKLSLPAEKINKICAEAWPTSKGEESISAQALARVVGKMNATEKLIPPAHAAAGAAASHSSSPNILQSIGGAYRCC